MLSAVVENPLQISSEGSYVNLASETSDESYSALLCLSTILNSPQGFSLFLAEYHAFGCS